MKVQELRKVFLSELERKAFYGSKQLTLVTLKYCELGAESYTRGVNWPSIRLTLNDFGMLLSRRLPPWARYA